MFFRKPRFSTAWFLAAAAAAFFAAPFSSAAASPKVRVLVAEKQKALSLTVKGACEIRFLPPLKAVQKAEHLIAVPVTASPSGIRLGRQEYVASGFVIAPARDDDLILGKSHFRGTLEIRKDGAGTFYAINRVDIEGYLYGVLHHEVAAWWPMEALKAQAVAARTYALYQASVNRAAEFDLRSSTSSQVYGGSTTERYRTKLAVDRTAGEVLTWQGKIFPAYFHATCAGRTAGAGELWKIDLAPVSGGVECHYCRLSPHYNWHARVPLSDIEEKLRQNARSIGRVLKIEPVSRTPSGRVGSLRITGTAGEAVVAAKDFRVWIGGDRMRSTLFTVVVHEDAAEFSGKGWGHGVGLCQWGAFGQALLGHAYREILRFYYPQSEIVSYEAL